jgi:hypothetical protein
MIEIRKLAAIDIAFAGPKFVITEFLLGVFGPLALGLFIAMRSHAPQQLVLAAYFASLGLNYDGQIRPTKEALDTPVHSQLNTARATDGGATKERAFQ